MSTRALAATLVALVMLAAPVVAQSGAGGAAPSGAHTLAAGNATLSYWVGNAASVHESVEQGESASIWFALAGEPGSRLVAFLNVTAGSASLAIENGTLVLDAPANGSASANVSYQMRIADAGRVNASYVFAGELYRETNGTLSLVAPISGSGAFVHDVGTLVPTPVTPGPLIPLPWLIVGGAVLVVGGGAAIVGMRQRAVKRRMNEGPRRSQVMREMEIEQKLEKAKAKDPEAAVVIQQEIRAAEKVRENRRELQILEAKRADALKTLDLLKKRHESGGLTKLQYDNMAAKKRDDLARIEAEIAAMEGQDPAAAS